MTLGDIIRQYRMTNRMTQEEFSKKSRLSTSMVRKLETNRLKKGVAPNPTMRTVSRVSRATGIPVEEIESLTGRTYREKLSTKEREQRKKETYSNFRKKNAEMKIYTPVGTYEKLKKAADLNGQSINGMVVGLIDEELKKERYKEL